MCYSAADAAADDAEAMARCKELVLEAFRIYEQSYQSHFDDADWDDAEIWDSFMQWISRDVGGDEYA